MSEAGRGHGRAGRGAAGHGRRGEGGAGRAPPVDRQVLVVPVLPRLVHVHVGVHARPRHRGPAARTPTRAAPRGGWERALGVALAAGVRAAPRSSPPDAAARPSSCMSDAKTANHTGKRRGRRGFYLDYFGLHGSMGPTCGSANCPSQAGSGFARRLEEAP